MTDNKSVSSRELGLNSLSDQKIVFLILFCLKRKFSEEDVYLQRSFVKRKFIKKKMT